QHERRAFVAVRLAVEAVRAGDGAAAEVPGPEVAVVDPAGLADAVRGPAVRRMEAGHLAEVGIGRLVGPAVHAVEVAAGVDPGPGHGHAEDVAVDVALPVAGVVADGPGAD